MSTCTPGARPETSDLLRERFTRIFGHPPLQDFAAMTPAQRADQSDALPRPEHCA